MLGSLLARVALAFAPLALAGVGAVSLAAETVLPLPPEDAREIAKFLGDGVVGKGLPASPIEDAAAYFPLVERSLVYTVTAGAGAGSIQTLQVAKGKRPGGSPAWRFQLSPSQSAFINQTDDGDLLMPAISDFDEGVVVATTPPNAFVLKGMRPGESRPFSQTVSVNYLDTPDKQDYAGSVSGTFAYVGAYELRLPAGTFETILLRTYYEGKIGPAHTQDTAYYFLSPGIGVAAMITQEDIEAFWVVHVDKTIGKMLKSK
jgi:hypothetical protein